MSQLQQAKRDLGKHKNPAKAQFLMRFFKTGPGQYAAGDRFLGIVVPTTRLVAKKHQDLSLAETFKLLESPLHEERLMALMILDMQFDKADAKLRKKIADGYVKRIAKYVNNWDLVDSSAQYILGEYLLDKPRTILTKLSKSKNLWERRVSIIATAHFIRNEDYWDTLRIAEILLHDKHDLIHKAVGWMVREVGNRDLKVETDFLDEHATKMPRTMLRYAIEKFPEKLRLKYLNAKA